MNLYGGPVSVVIGRRQAPTLRFVTVTSWLLAGLGALAENRWATLAGIIAISLVMATPLVRVGWLMMRWREERDLRFFWIGAALLSVVAAGALLALLAATA